MVRTRDKFVIPQSIIEQALRTAKDLSSSGNPEDVLAPIDDFNTYTALLEAVVDAAAAAPADDLLVVSDGGTVSHVRKLEQLGDRAKSFMVLGDLPDDWERIPSVSQHDIRGDVTTHDHFLVAISSAMHFAVIGKAQPDDEVGEMVYNGGWTSVRSFVRRVAEVFLNAYGSGPVLEIKEEVGGETGALAAMKVISTVSKHITARESNLAMMKDDLFSVLDILKKISSRRRAHDILYTFVERVAKIINADRCSVVRVWGGEDIGHVLASQDDKSISDLSIDLKKYPEIRRALEKRRKVIIPDVFEDPMTKPFQEEFKVAKLSSVNIIPMVLYDENVGSLFLRTCRKSGTFTMREISFCEIAAEAAANALERAHLFESIQEANQRLEHLAITDGLTELYNHRYFRERLEEEFERARRYGQPLSCIIIDLDDFKKINDTYGHLVGDSLLKEIGLSIRAAVRKNDVVARYGGEEFVALMPQTGLEGGRTEAERLCREVAVRSFSDLPEDYRVTVSIGLAVLDTETMNSVDAFIRAADDALYVAKTTGKNKVVVHDPQKAK